MSIIPWELEPRTQAIIFSTLIVLKLKKPILGNVTKNKSVRAERLKTFKQEGHNVWHHVVPTAKLFAANTKIRMFDHKMNL